MNILSTVEDDLLKDSTMMCQETILREPFVRRKEYGWSFFSTERVQFQSSAYLSRSVMSESP